MRSTTTLIWEQNHSLGHFLCKDFALQFCRSAILERSGNESTSSYIPLPACFNERHCPLCISSKQALIGGVTDSIVTLCNFLSFHSSSRSTRNAEAHWVARTCQTTKHQKSLPVFRSFSYKWSKRNSERPGETMPLPPTLHGFTHTSFTYKKCPVEIHSWHRLCSINFGESQVTRMSCHQSQVLWVCLNLGEKQVLLTMVTVSVLCSCRIMQLQWLACSVAHIMISW